MIELHKTEIELIKRMMKLIEILKLDPHRYTIQLGEQITAKLKLHNPTVKEHYTIKEHHGLPTITMRNSIFSVTSEWQLYEFTYPDIRDD